MILARGSRVFLLCVEGSLIPHFQGGKYGAEKEVSIWGRGEPPSIQPASNERENCHYFQQQNNVAALLTSVIRPERETGLGQHQT